ncbi:hypothetical protein [Shewanella sp. Shew256]|uniref:hypothetical protein n=1 Tax=Shewanella sp. Shew256 TaxID=1969376 RepID=UPI000B4A2975|nr:hypothetical protein [Shewanella sp. Shew256]
MSLRLVSSRLLIGGLSLILSACASSNMSNTSCDFVRGTAGNQSKRETSGDDSNARQMDVGIGILTAIFGSISRALSSDDSSDEKCV